MNEKKDLGKKARSIILQEGSYLLEQSVKLKKDRVDRDSKNSSSEITTKSSFRDLVTSIDLELENRLKEKLYGILPGSDFLAEETAKSMKDSDKLWIIDPIDGTTNFVHGFPFFCISVALHLAGKPVLGFVYNPVMNEFFEAESKSGSFLNNKPIKVSATVSLKQSLLATGFAYNFAVSKEDNIDNFKRFQAKSRGIRRLGSAALDICYVASGVLDGFWELFLSPWDVAAGILITEEAGGRVTDFRGREYSFSDKDILITNSLIHNEMIDELRESH